MEALNRLQPWHMLILAAVLYLPFTFLGYGSDVDAYRVLAAGRNFWQSSDYVPSRRPVFIVHEMMTFLLDGLGGSLLANLGTLAMSLLALYSFYRICQHYRVGNIPLLMAVMILHPVYLVNSTCSMDYLWAVGFFLVAYWLMLQGRYPAAGLALGLSMGTRLSSGIEAAAILLLFFITRREDRGRILLSTAISFIITALAIVLPWDFTEWSPGFWTLSTGAQELWTFPMRAGRFLYKNIYFWGLPATFLLTVALLPLSRGRKALFACEKREITILSLCVILLNQVLFFLNPIEIEYLLPTLPFWLFLLGIGLAEKKTWLFILLVAVLLTNLVSINIARPDTPSAASGASFGVWIEPGYTLTDVAWRQLLMGCENNDCYEQRIPPYSR